MARGSIFLSLFCLMLFLILTLFVSFIARTCMYTKHIHTLSNHSSSRTCTTHNRHSPTHIAVIGIRNAFKIVVDGMKTQKKKRKSHGRSQSSPHWLNISCDDTFFFSLRLDPLLSVFFFSWPP
jgi:hypothetical protein